MGGSEGQAAIQDLEFRLREKISEKYKVIKLEFIRFS
jgi:hypothetical protein